MRAIDFTIAILLLSGQLRLIGVFIESGSFVLAVSGPVTGGAATGRSGQANFGLQFVDMIAALLLILGEIDFIGTFIRPKQVALALGGPPFGMSKMQGYSPAAVGFFLDYRDELIHKTMGG